MRPGPRTLLALTAAALANLAAIGPVPANAGTYVVSACSPLSSPGAWSEINTAPAGLTAGQACGGPAIGPLGIGDQGALYAEDNLGASSQIANGAAAGWAFTAPPATTITAISYYRALAAYNESRSGRWSFRGQRPAARAVHDPAGRFCSGDSIVCSMPNTQAPVTFSGLSTSGLFFGVTCRIVDGAGACIDGGTIHAAQADLYSAQVTLSETAAPTLSQITGSPWGAGVVFGTQPVAFAASDPSGIQHDAIRADTGQTLASADQACDFTRAQPCPQLPTGSLSVDTTHVPDGPHTLSLVAVDAAGNASVATSPALVVDNNGPPAPTRLTATPANGNSLAINLTWTNPASPPAPVASATAQLCQATCAPPVAVGGAGVGQLTAPAAGAYTVRLWLLDTAGRGGPQNAAQASVTIPGTTSPPGGSTGGSGGHSAKLRTKITATIKAGRLRVRGTIAAIKNGTVRVSWRARRSGRSVASGSRSTNVHQHKLDVTFTLSHTARSGTIGVAVRSGHRQLAGARARP